jgi:hypothetical protein
MDESLQDLADDMKRKADLGLVPAAQAVCAGIVQGLYQTRHVKSDGALGWAPDFPTEHAGYIVRSVEEFVGNPYKYGGLTAEGTMSFSL